jgi:hypothetical protein
MPRAIASVPAPGSESGIVLCATCVDVLHVTGAGIMLMGSDAHRCSLGDVATIGILQHRAAGEYRLLAAQLQFALNSRVMIEQARAVLAQAAGLDMDGCVRGDASRRGRTISA